MRQILIALLLLAVPVLAEPQDDSLEESRFTMDEAEIFVAKKQWSDLIFRLPDIATSERGPKWEQLVEKAAVNYAAELAVESPSNALTALEGMPMTFPSLGRSLTFEEVKHKIAFMGFESCYTTNAADVPECQKRFLEYVKKGRNVPELSFRAGKLVSKVSTAPNAYPFFKMAVSPLTRARFCGEPSLKKTLLEVSKSSDRQLASDALELSSKCRLK